jgi:site-specific recombinase XerD
LPLSEDQVNHLLNAAATSEYPLRNKAIILFLLDTGVRASEMCALRPRDIDKDARTAVVLGKGNKRRVVYYGRTVASALAAYQRLDVRESDEPLFFSERGTAAGCGLTRCGLTQLIERLAKRANIFNIRCSPHSLRHTWALNFVRAGGNVFALRELLGHTSLTISQTYVHLAGADLEAQSRLASPIDNMTRRRR